MIRRVKNWELKVFSLVVAVLLAYFVNNTNNSSVISFIVPIEVARLPADKVIVWPLNRQAQITVKGPSFLVSRIAASPPAFRVEIPRDVKNQYVVSLNPGELNLSPAVQVVSVEPPEVEFTFDALAKKEVPVEVPRIGSVDQNLALTEFTVDPPRIVVTGPESEIKQVTQIETRPLDLRSIVHDVEQELPVRKAGPLLRLSPDAVLVKIKVSSVKILKKFNSLPIEVRAEPGNSYAVTPDRVAVEISGPKQLVDGLKEGEVVPYIRPEADGKAAARVAVDTPAGITAARVDPQEVQVQKRK